MDTDKLGAEPGLPVLVVLYGGLLDRNARGRTIVVGADDQDKASGDLARRIHLTTPPEGTTMVRGVTLPATTTAAIQHHWAISFMHSECCAERFACSVMAGSARSR